MWAEVFLGTLSYGTLVKQHRKRSSFLASKQLDAPKSNRSGELQHDEG